MRNRALLHLLRGELERAEQDIRSALQVNQYFASAKLLLGVLQALRGDLIRAQTTWQEGLILYPEHDLRSRVHRTIYTVALGQPEQGLAELQRILQQEKPPAGLLRAVLEIAHLLQRCPEPLPGLAEAVRLLERGRENAPVFELKPRQRPERRQAGHDPHLRWDVIEGWARVASLPLAPEMERRCLAQPRLVRSSYDAV